MCIYIYIHMYICVCACDQIIYIYIHTYIHILTYLYLKSIYTYYVCARATLTPRWEHMIIFRQCWRPVHRHGEGIQWQNRHHGHFPESSRPVSFQWKSVEQVHLAVEPIPLKYELVNWDDDSSQLNWKDWKSKVHVPNHQPARFILLESTYSILWCRACDAAIQ